MDQKTVKDLFYFGIAVFCIGIVSVFVGYVIPGPVETLEYQLGDATYFWPFLNYATILGIAISVFAVVMQKKGKRQE